MPNVQLANNLKYLRRQRELSQDYLSELLNISRQACSNYETSRRTPDLDTLLFLSGFYQVGLNDLVLGNLSNPSDISGILTEEPVPYTYTMHKKTGNTFYLTDEEMDVITRFRTLSEGDKKIVTSFLIANARHLD